MQPEQQEPSQPIPQTKKSHDFKGILGNLLLLVALLIIAGMLFVWKPWEGTPGANARTVTVQGEAEITAEPDEFTFTPRYEFKNVDKKTALAESTAKTNEVVKKLKDLGVADSKIKTDTSGYDSYYFYGEGQQTYYSSFSVKVDKKALAQKVQDYLLTTEPYGEITPQADFSKAKRKQLTDKGRDEASKDARAKAERSAENLGFKISKVKSVTDNPNDYFEPYLRDNLMSGVNDATTSSESLPIQAGENNLTYKITVTYYIK